MTYNVFSEMLNPTQSVNQSVTICVKWLNVSWFYTSW